jgi:hypothetical protein
MPRPISWFRSNSGKFAWLAFFALACQFALSFGHVHFSNVSATVLAISADSANGSATARSPPAQQAPTSLAQDICAVCNNINLANTLVLPVSPAPLPPISIIRDLHWPLITVGFASDNRFHFNARGPPRA